MTDDRGVPPMPARARFDTRAQPRILVVGDAMLDSYWHGTVERISPEAPVPVLSIQGQSEQPGGAANVAVSLASLGAEVGLLTVLGQDDAGVCLVKGLGESGVTLHAVIEPGFTTTRKIRCVSQRHQLLRADVETRPRRSSVVLLGEHFDRLLADYDLVVLSDYDKGTLTDVARLLREATLQGMPTLVDPKGSDYRRYQGATLIKPNLKELCAVVGACEPGTALFVRRAERLRRQLKLQHLLVTQGDLGMTLFNDDGPQHVAAHRQEVFDVSGAGDTVMAVLAYMLSLGEPMDEAVRWANVAGGLAVRQFGTAALSWPALMQAAQEALHRDAAGGDWGSLLPSCMAQQAFPADLFAPYQGER